MSTAKWQNIAGSKKFFSQNGIKIMVKSGVEFFIFGIPPGGKLFPLLHNREDFYPKSKMQ